MEEQCSCNFVVEIIGTAAGVAMMLTCLVVIAIVIALCWWR
jgi:hypothetical protein